MSEFDLNNLILLKKIDSPVLGAELDGLPHDARIRAVRGLTKSSQRRLFEMVEGFRALCLDDLVPAEIAPLSPVRHYGKNSLPAFRLFEKRFYRTKNQPGVAGANFQRVSPLTGPGYFVVREDRARGEALIDYCRLPEEAPAGWPSIRTNERGVSRLVYGFMVDTLRRVSEHVTVGAAVRHGRPMDAYFVLCREASS